LDTTVVRSPIEAACAVKGPPLHVLLVGAGAERFAQAQADAAPEIHIYR
jgi:isoaspartyl peptidase/L-asparaginase-like protein (Ntn-hydrolase superfamily)